MNPLAIGKQFIEALVDFAIKGAEGKTQDLLAQGLSTIESQFLSKIGVKLGAEDFAPFGAVSYWNRITKSIMDVNQGLGIGGKLGENIRESFRGSLADAAELGAEYSDIAAEYKAFTEELGRTRQLTSQELVELVKYQQLFGEGASDVFATYSMLGVSFENTSESIQQIAIDSNKIGVNYSKVVKELKNNLGIINRLSFNKGRRGMEKMAELAVKTRISMETASKFAEGIFEDGIEGAIEMGANLQMLGGDMAALGDPFELFYLARNAPEELQKRLADVTEEVASFNQQTGEIDINALGMSRLRELAKATQTPLDELVQSARILRKESEIETRFDYSIQGRGDFDELLSKVAGAAEFDTNVNDWVVNIGEETKKISELTPEMIGELDFIGTEKVADVNERLIKSNESLNDTMQRLVDQLKITLLGGVEENYDRMYQVTRQFADNVRQMVERGDLDVVIESFKNLSKASFENIMTLFERASTGDFLGVGQQLMSNISDVLTAILNVIGQTALFMLRGFVGVIQWAVESLGTMIVNAIIWLGNSILGISKSKNKLGYFESPDPTKYFVEPMKDFVKNIMPDFVDINDEDIDKKLENMFKDFGESTNTRERFQQSTQMQQNDLEERRQMQEQILRQTIIQENQPTDLNVNLRWTGEPLKIELPDGTIQEVSKEQVERMLQYNGVPEPKTKGR